MNIADWIAKWADFEHSKLAVRFGSEDISYGALDDRIIRTARVLEGRFGIGRGDRVAHLGYNSPVNLYLLFACARLGAIYVPLNWRLAAPEHLYVLENANPKILVAEPDFFELADAIESTSLDLALIGQTGAAQDPRWQDFSGLLNDHADVTISGDGALDDPLMIVYTSGTTGKPKGAVLDQNALFWNSVNSRVLHDLSSRDHTVMTLPLFHVGGMNILTTPTLHAGASLTLHRTFDPEATLRAIDEEKPSLILLVPAQVLAMQRHPLWEETDVSSLRLVNMGSSIVPEPMIREWQKRGVHVQQSYGSTETCPIATHGTRFDPPDKALTAGKPALHCDIRLVDEDGRDVANGETGELLVRGPNVMRGYWKDEEASQFALRDGWYHSGDVAYRDGDGYYVIVDRKRDVIISGGENIYPAELEALLYEHEEIVEAAVVGKADDKWGEVPIAYVSLTQGSELTPESILALFENQLARFKHPKAAVVLDSLPRNAMGKILKYELRERAAKDQAGGG